MNETNTAFPDQLARYHPRDFVADEALLEQVRKGKAIIVQGLTLAMAEAAAKAASPDEILFYFLADRANPYLLKKLYIPHQTTSSGFCRVEGAEVTSVARLARKQNMFVAAEGHSHGRGAVFSSQMDVEQMEEMAAEGIGYLDVRRTRFAGEVFDADGADGGRKRMEVVFPDANGGVKVHIVSSRNDLSPQDLHVELERETRRRASCFATTNAWGEHLFPVFYYSTCPECGRTEKEFSRAYGVEVHVIGPVEISEEDKAAIGEEVAEKVAPDYRWSSQWSDSKMRPWGENYKARPEDFVITRRGNIVAVLDAVVLERAAAANRELAEALGWARSANVTQKNAVQTTKGLLYGRSDND
jgi:hypothetical protein